MLNEIDIMRALDHENVIKVYEVFETEKSIYLVLELIQGKSLQEMLKKPSFREEYSEVKIINMFRSILDALAYLAVRGVMHRDLKPDNILIDKGDKIKIVDFGLATFIDIEDYLFKKCGTPGYIAPEVFKYDAKNPNTAYDHKCDVFSAGAILFYM
jgi:serine/threonine protein kinase